MSNPPGDGDEDDKKDDKPDKTYAVGKGRPPKKGQFRKGQSGNPSGRPKAQPTAAQLFEKELNKTLDLNGERITKAEIVVKRVVNDAAGGKAVPLKLAMEQLKARERHAVLMAAPETPLNEDQLAVLRAAVDFDYGAYAPADIAAIVNPNNKDSA